MRTGLWLGCGLSLLVACGSGPIAVDDDETGSTDDEVGTTDADSNSDSDSDSDSGSDTTGETPDGCFGAVGFVVVPHAGSTVTIQEPGGDSFEIDASGPLDDDPSFLVDASTDHIAIVTNQSSFNQQLVHASVLRLFARGSNVPIYTLESETTISRVFVGDDGGVTALAQDGQGLYVSPAGVSQSLGSFQPGGPVVDGWIPGRHADEGVPVDSGFLELDGDGFVAVGVGGHNHWTVVDGTIEQLAGETFHRGTPEWSESVQLPPGTSAQEATAGDFRIVVAYVDGDKLTYRLDVTAGELLEIAPELPPGLEPFDCYHPVNRVDGQGRITFELRDESSARVMLWDPDTDEWTQLGQAVSSVDDVEPYSLTGASFSIAAVGLGQTFCPLPEWGEPPPRALLDHSNQYVRVDPPLRITIDAPLAWNLTVDPDDRCLAWTDGEVTVMTELDTEETLELPFTGSLTWLPV